MKCYRLNFRIKTRRLLFKCNTFFLKFGFDLIIHFVLNNWIFFSGFKIGQWIWELLQLFSVLYDLFKTVDRKIIWWKNYIFCCVSIFFFFQCIRGFCCKILIQYLEIGRKSLKCLIRKNFFFFCSLVLSNTQDTIPSKNNGISSLWDCIIN